MTDEAYLGACRKLASPHDNNQTSMGDYPNAVQKLKEQYLEGTSKAALPVVP